MWGCAMAITLAKSDTIDLTAFGEELAFFHLLGLGISENARLAKGGIDTCEVWCSHPVEKLKEYCNVVKIKMFWSLLFSRKSITFADEFSSLFMGWNVDAIWEFNVLEDLVDLIKKVVNIPHFISGVLRIGSGIENVSFWGCSEDSLRFLSLEAEVFFHLEEAVDWIRCVGDSGMLHNLEQLADSGRVKVEVIFAEWASCILRVALGERDLLEDFKALTCESSRKKSEFLKQRGNAEFSQGALASAIVFYTKAMDLWKAVIDGKRAIVLKPDWPKGHHHYCKGLALQGKADLALEANKKAQELCQNHPEGLKELVQQCEKLKIIVRETPDQSQQNKQKPKPKTSDNGKMRDNLDLKKESKAVEDKSFSAEPQVDLNPDVNPLGLEGAGTSLDRGRPTLLNLLRAMNTPEFTVDFNSLPEGVTGLARDGCRFLLEQRCHEAERAFSQLLSIFFDSGFPYMRNILNINYVILFYGHATALLGIGTPEALAKAEDQFKKIIEDYPEESCFCLAHYGLGRVYLKQNRFARARDQFARSKLMMDFKIVPGVLTWPGTSQVIEESRMENLQVALKNYLEKCRFPPEPDAVCRYQQCHGYSKIQIYFTDPDFKGFIRIICSQQCRLEFHISCWKKLKTASYSDKNDKFEQKIPKPKEPPRACIKQKSSSLRKIKMKQEKKLWRKRAREEARNSARKKPEEKQEGNEESQYSQHGGCGQDLCAGDQVLQHLQRNREQIKAAVADAAELLKELLEWGVIREDDFTSCSQMSSSQEVLEQLLSSLIQARSRVRTRAFLHVLSQLGEVDPKVHKWLRHLDNLGLTATKNFLLQYGQVLQELDLSILTPLWNRKYGNKFDCVAADSEKQEICDYFLAPPLEKSRCFIWLLEENREDFPGLHQALDEFFDKMDDPTIILKKQGNENLSNNEIKVKNKNRKKNWKDSKSILVLSSGVSTASREEEKIFIEEQNNLYRDYPNEPFVIPEYLQEQLEEFEALYNVSNSNGYMNNNNNNNPDPICENLYDYFSQILEEHGPLEINNKLLIGEYENFPAETRKVVEEAGGLEPFLLKSLRFILLDNLIGLRKHSALFEGNPSGSRPEDKTESDAAGQLQRDSCRSNPPLNPYAEEFKPLSYSLPPPPSSLPDLTAYETPQYFPCPFPAPCAAGNVLELGAAVPLKALEPAVLLPQSSWGYQYGILPVVPAALYADPAAPRAGRFGPGGSVPPEGQGREGLWGWRGGSERERPAPPDGSGETAAREKGRREKAGTDGNAHTRMAAVQVNQEVADRETNTLPFHPFENQKGDILRMEKEHRVLTEQLREAEEKFEQLQSRSLEEISAAEELLKKSIEETEVSQNELDWFHQDSDAQMKKWQQEKKENRENLKALRATAKKHSDTNERYLKTVDDKEKQYNACLNTFLETSNKFANEKGKLEELIKKSQSDSQECEKRAVKAEISVLQTWKETEIWKLTGSIAKAEGNLRMLKAVSSSDLMALIKEVQRRNGNAAVGLSQDQILSRVTELILDRQLQASCEDPCTICHDELSRDCCGLECGHHFHSENQSRFRINSVPPPNFSGAALAEEPPPLVPTIPSLQLGSSSRICLSPLSLCPQCIRTWLKQHSTCPMCRVHALLPEDFPELPAWNKYG
ncbi:hypothetical protein DUI87_15560 [Hirundo rustica rustica]|uniref:CARD domain-containing protein n=1 Tax=Hirundo rustica rustica TaxID=333673 RepID=A0A3M0K4Y5_HIRRU|nr:hypothetical protein DUI87_15560 [Hirundo rustica rustica]